MRPLTIAALVVAFLACVTPARAHWTPRPPAGIDNALRVASTTYRVSYWTLRSKAWCESRYNPRARNRSSGAAGLLQFLRSTWATTPYRRLNPYDPYANALAAAWMHAHGRGGEWVCR